MISKETFVNTMNRLYDLDERMDVADAALKKLSPDFCGLYITDIFDIAIGLLEDVMNDKDGWVSYFVYERDWLRDMHLGDVEVNGNPVKIENWADVYDFIVGENE